MSQKYGWTFSEQPTTKCWNELVIISYIDWLPASDRSPATDRSSETTEKTLPFSAGNSVTSETSSQKQKELVIAKKCIEEVEYLHEVTLCLAKPKQD